MWEGDWDQLWSHFNQLLELSEQQRSERIDELCRNDDALRAELESLLAAHAGEATLLDRPLLDSAEVLVFTPPDRVGAYQIERVIGRGGMGDVYLARRHDDQFQHTVAIKFAATGQLSPAVLRRFTEERQILSSLNHPNIARLYDGGTTDDGTPYLVMEYLDGKPLDQFCDINRLTVNQRLALFRLVCGAVSYAHQNLIIHCDIKPSNILVDEHGLPKLLDFGIAQLVHPGQDAVDRVEQRGAGLATPCFASPEQLQGMATTTASDIYSLGVLLHLLLSGRLPDEGNLPRSVADSDLALIVSLAMQPEPQRRYQSVEHLAEDISRYLSHLPVRAHPGGVAYRLGKLIRRHPFRMAAVSLLALLSVLFTVLTLRHAGELERTLAETRRAQQTSDEVTEFLKSLMQQSDPLRSEGVDQSARALLDRGRIKLENSLQAQPRVRAELLVTLGSIYANLSDYERAEQLVKEGFELQQQVLGESHAKSISTQLLLARILADQGQTELALASLRRTLKVAEQQQPPDPSNRARIHLRLGRLYQSMARLDEAEEEIFAGRRIVLSHSGGETPLAAEADLMFGGLLWRRGRYEEARGPYERALAVFATHYGDNHHMTLRARASIGMLMMRLGHYPAAEAHLSAVAARRLQTLGQDHSLTAEAQNALGALFYESGKYRRAVSVLEPAAGTQQLLLGSDSTQLAQTLNNLALSYQQLNELERAEAMFRRALKINRSQYGEPHFKVASTLNNLGLVLLDQNRLEAARLLFLQAVEMLVAVYGEHHPAPGYAMTNLARSLAGLGEFDDAADWFDQALELRRRLLKPDHPALAETLTRYGEFELARGRGQSARKQLAEALAIREQQLSPGDWRTAETRVLLGEAQISTGTPESGAQNMVQGMVDLREMLGRDHPRSVAAGSRLVSQGLPLE